MDGFSRTIRDELDIKIREHMLDYVIDLLDDAINLSRSSAKASHAVLLCHMEQNEIKSWLETEKINRERRAHAERHSTSQGSSQRTQYKHSTAKTTTCVYYVICETKGVLYEHVCESCWSKDGKSHPHPQIKCR